MNPNLVVASPINIYPIPNQPGNSSSQKGNSRLPILLWVMLALVSGANCHHLVAQTDESTARADAAQQPVEIDKPILEFVNTYCLDCHQGREAEAMLDLERFRTTADLIRTFDVWKRVLTRVQKGEMPPPDATRIPDKSERDFLVAWTEQFVSSHLEEHAGAPGPVHVRHLSNAEYDNCIRDLTAVDLHPAASFPVDPANEAGFDNSAESLTMSPALTRKYLEAARLVVDHLVLTPTGMQFAPHAVVTDTDRDKYCVKRIVNFYQNQPTRYEDYLLATWEFHRRYQQQPAATRASIAEREGISAKYLELVWDILSSPEHPVGPLAALRAKWRDMLAVATREAAQVQASELDRFITDTRRRFEPKFENLDIDGVHKGTQAFVLWKNGQYATHRRRGDTAAIEREFTDWLADGSHEPTSSEAGQPATLQPTTADRQAFTAACQWFCSVFPDAFYVSERGRDYVGKPKDEQEKGRLLSAGFHSMMGYFRDDQPLQELVLDDAACQQLDALWQQLDFVTSAPMRQYQGFLWFDRTDSRFMRDAQFDFARPEDKHALAKDMIVRLGQVYLEKATASGGDSVALQAIADYFETINAQIRWVEQARLQAEPHHIVAVLEFARRAYRRPLTQSEQEELREYYQRLRQQQELTHEEAIQDVIVAVLMSPEFLYRLDLACQSAEIVPLRDYELATRLSFFLWSSLPDDQLLDLAASGKLREPDALMEQTRRMLDDPRVRGLATEFGANWLDIRRFLSHNSVDRQQFPSFDDNLRAAMFEEPIHFLVDLIQQDRSALDLIYSTSTFVNATLARHYGVANLVFSDADQWLQVDRAGDYHRGGLLPMAVFQTQNAPGLRTSPVKRGYWVVRRLLGEQIPAPPPNVPELPSDESKLGELTLSEALAQHRAHSSCAGCHDRFDSIGLVMENFGPIGEWREIDLGGKHVDSRAAFPDGKERVGINGLIDYIRQEREADFIDNLTRKLLAFALGRSLILSDEPLLADMRRSNQERDLRFRSLIEQIVISPQFLNKQGVDR
ncbi:MAG: DUF1592 domain-containing protein [Planctomycetales bacterium]|nr:DUF1592 domain-containing protein [Planctomycetales bacterium]